VRLEQIARVVGLSDSVLFDKDNPTAPVNRRISIIVLNKKAADSIETGAGRSDQPLIDLTRPTEEQQQEAREQLERGDWFEERPEPAPGELNW
jgi:chemotaxis protein MotB